MNTGSCQPDRAAVVCRPAAATSPVGASGDPPEPAFCALDVAETLRTAVTLPVEDGAGLLIGLALAGGPWTCGSVADLAASGALRIRASSGSPPDQLDQAQRDPAQIDRAQLDRAQLDRAQWDLGGGPAHDVLTAGLQADVVVAADLADDSRWPLWSAGAVDLGVRAALAIRLHVGGRTLGALTLYARNAVPAVTDSLLAGPRAIAAQLSVLIWMDDQRRHLERAIDSHGRVGQAMGMIMHRDRVAAEEAFDLLRRTSQHRNVKISALVADLTDPSTLPPPRGPGHPE
jgi:GAF domain-containing protein